MTQIIFLATKSSNFVSEIIHFEEHEKSSKFSINWGARFSMS